MQVPDHRTLARWGGVRWDVQRPPCLPTSAANVGTRGGGGGPTFAPEVQRPGGKRGRRTSHLPTLTLPRYLGKVLPCPYIRPLLSSHETRIRNSDTKLGYETRRGFLVGLEFRNPPEFRIRRNSSFRKRETKLFFFEFRKRNSDTKLKSRN